MSDETSQTEQTRIAMFLYRTYASEMGFTEPWSALPHREQCAWHILATATLNSVNILRKQIRTMQETIERYQERDADTDPATTGRMIA